MPSKLAFCIVTYWRTTDLDDKAIISVRIPYENKLRPVPGPLISLQQRPVLNSQMLNSMWLLLLDKRTTVIWKLTFVFQVVVQISLWEVKLRKLGFVMPLCLLLTTWSPGKAVAETCSASETSLNTFLPCAAKRKLRSYFTAFLLWEVWHFLSQNWWEFMALITQPSFALARLG